VELAPAIGALVGIGSAILWQLRWALLARAVLAAGLCGTAVWASVLLDRAPNWQPWLRVLGLTAPAAYAVGTAVTPHGGAIPSVGPQGGGFGGGPGRFPGPGFPGQRFSGQTSFGHGPGGNGFAGGGLLGGTTSNTALNALLARDADRYVWVAAAVGSNMAAGFQLTTGHPVMPVGGFNGSDPSPTLAQFQHYVARGAIHYFIGGGGFPGQHGGSSNSQQIADWVQQNFTAMSVGGATVYDLATAR
jgi:hypothetical protein